MSILEEDWNKYHEDAEGKNQTALTAAILLGGFVATLRGEKIVQTDIGAMRENWDEAINYPEQSHVPFMLAGRFKGQIEEKLFFQPLAIKMKSGL